MLGGKFAIIHRINQQEIGGVKISNSALLLVLCDFFRNIVFASAFGCMPKGLLLDVVRQLACLWGCVKKYDTHAINTSSCFGWML
jgi:hypothetical protein